MSNELAHYGILGMKWGVRRFQPYPKGHTGGRYTGPKTGYNDKYKSPQPKRKKYRGPSGTKKMGSSNISSTTHKTHRSTEDQKKRNRKASSQHILTSVSNQAMTFATQKVVNSLIDIGASTPQAIMIVKGAKIVSGYFDSGAASAKVDRIRGRNNYTVNKKLSKVTSVEDIQKHVVSGVNPGYGKELGTVNNCLRSTFAYELRRRGLDVEARKTANATGQTVGGMARALGKSNYKGQGVSEQVNTGLQAMMSKVTKGKANTPLYDFKKKVTKDQEISTSTSIQRLKGMVGMTGDLVSETSENTFKGLSRQPNGSRGNLNFMWASGGGHSIAYEIIDNKPVLFDTQNGAVFKSPKDLVDAGYAAVSVNYTRLDNVELDMNFMERWVKQAR